MSLNAGVAWRPAPAPGVHTRQGSIVACIRSRKAIVDADCTALQPTKACESIPGIRKLLRPLRVVLGGVLQHAGPPYALAKLAPRGASGQAAAAPPTRGMNLRRLMGTPWPDTVYHIVPAVPRHASQQNSSAIGSCGSWSCENVSARNARRTISKDS